MPVPSSIADLSTTAASNSPAGSDAIGTSLDDYLRTIQAIIKRENSKGSDITAATTIDIPSDGSYFVVTGNTTITGISDDWNGRTCALKFSGTPQLTHSSGFILPGAANITVAAGDMMIVANESTGVWRVVAYQRASGAAVAASGSIASSGYTQSTSRVLGRSTAGTGAIEELTLSGVLDLVGSAAQGDILYRDAAGWARLAAGTSGNYLKTQGSGANPTWAAVATSGVTLGTPVASTSGTSIDFTSLPAGTKRITVNFIGVSTNGTSIPQIQIGDSGGVEASGYTSLAASYVATGGANINTSTAGFTLKGFAVAATNTLHGSVVLTLENSTNNTWSAFGVLHNSTAAVDVTHLSGSKSLSPGPLDRVRITTAGGTDTFDAGEINITYE